MVQCYLALERYDDATRLVRRRLARRASRGISSGSPGERAWHCGVMSGWTLPLTPGPLP